MQVPPCRNEAVWMCSSHAGPEPFLRSTCAVIHFRISSTYSKDVTAPLWTDYALRGSLSAFNPLLCPLSPPASVFLLPDHFRDPIPPCPWHSAATITTQPLTMWMPVSSTTAASWTPSQWCRTSSCSSSHFLSSSSVSVRDR